MGKLLGCPEPRLYTPPLRPLTRQTTRGYEVIDFAKMIGQPLLPWQEFAVLHALERSEGGTYRFRTVLVLVARQNGKTSLKRVVSLWRMYVDGAARVLGVGQNVALARIVMNECVSTIKAHPALAEEFKGSHHYPGDEYFTLISGSEYRIGAANRSSSRGLPVDELNIDELREQRTWDGWSALSKTVMARPNAQIWAMSNAGDDQSVVLNHLREAALSGRDPSICLLEWSAPDGCDLDDTDAWCQANPGLGHMIESQSIESAMLSDPPAIFRTEVLCQKVDALDSALDIEGWKAGRDPSGSMNGLRSKISLCVDVAPDGQHVTLVAAALMADNRVRVEVVAAWRDTDQARAELPDLITQVTPASIAWFPGGPAAALGATLSLIPGVTAYKGADVPEVCMGLADLVKARRVVHADDPLLNAQAAGAARLRQGDGWRFVRLGAGHVDGMYATAGAVHAALTLPDVQPLRPMIVVRERSA